jgi:hypothetical protein
MRKLPSDNRGFDAPLTVDIEDNEIVIRIGIGTVAWAFDHMEENNPWSDDKHDYVQKWKVSDPVEFAKDVVGELTNEEEDGSHPLNRLLDQVSTAAADQGSLGIEEVMDGKSSYARDYEETEEQCGKAISEENIDGGTEASTSTR